jgi:hypothetical protein
MLRLMLHRLLVFVSAIDVYYAATDAYIIYRWLR